MSIPAEYTDRKTGVRFALDINGRVQTGESIKMENIKKIQLQATDPRYVFSWEEGDAKGEAQKDFWMNHELVKPVHGKNDNLENHMFDLVIPQAIQLQKFTDLKLKGRIYNYVASLEANEQELRNLAFYYGVIPSENKDAVFYALADFNAGRLMQSDVMYSFFDDYTKDNDEVRLKTMVKKAVVFKVFEKKDNVYFLSNSPIGSTVEQLIVYCMENKEMYESFIIPEVQRRDQFIAPVKENKVKGDPSEINVIKKLHDSKDNAMNSTAELVSMRGDAKALKIGSTHVMGRERLTAEIANAKALYAKAESLGIDHSRIVTINELPALIEKAEKKLATV